MHPDKGLCFQGLYGFYRKHPVSLNFLKTIENTGEIGICNIFCSIQNSLWRVVLQLIYGIDHAFHVRVYVPLGSRYLCVAHDFLDRKRVDVFHREGCSGCMAA